MLVHVTLDRHRVESATMQPRAAIPAGVWTSLGYSHFGRPELRLPWEQVDI